MIGEDVAKREVIVSPKREVTAKAAKEKRRSQSLVRGLHLNAIEVATASSAQGGDKYAAPSGNQKCAKTSVGHLIVSGMAFFGKRSFCIEDFVDKTEETSLEGSPSSP
ncbi:hypothetical protein L3X38_010080 [Prunus dulcis]|uniref:Uncharacterized protein n=1 Tax=Prunus dulcis TaxID=3755 RepID=A0AAD4ZDP2_PRUDU|nr:hypothetical protein L3X38_010080 [Prunus dulcis]